MDSEQLKHAVSEFLALLGVVVDDVRVAVGHRTIVAVSSPDATLLIGPNGEHLRSINTIMRRLVEEKHGTESANFIVDINGFHEQKMELVRAAARMLAQRARLFKRDVEMEPMSAYERLVIHELFADDQEIETHSDGEGKFRHIVLKYKSSQPLSAL